MIKNILIAVLSTIVLLGLGAAAQVIQPLDWLRDAFSFASDYSMLIAFMFLNEQLAFEFFIYMTCAFALGGFVGQHGKRKNG